MPLATTTREMQDLGPYMDLWLGVSRGLSPPGRDSLMTSGVMVLLSRDTSKREIMT